MDTQKLAIVRYKKYIELVDKEYEDILIKQHGKDFKYIMEIPSNFCVYPNYKSCHEEGYLTDGYHLEEEEDYLSILLSPLGYNNLSESTYGWEFGQGPLFSKEDLVKLLNQSKFIEATTDCPFMNEIEEIEQGKKRQELYANMFNWSNMAMLEEIEDYLA